MRTTLFNISLEDDIIAASDPTEGTDINVTEVIEQQEVNEEIASDTNVIEDVNEAIEESLEVAEELEEQVAENEEKLEESPEEITPDDVQASQEAFQIKLSALGMSHDEICVNRISVESMVNNPVEAFRVSTEDIKETIKKIWEKIKQFFNAIWTKIKNLFNKIKSFLGFSKKKEEKLQNDADNVANEINQLDSASLNKYKQLCNQHKYFETEEGKKAYEANPALTLLLINSPQEYLTYSDTREAGCQLFKVIISELSKCIKKVTSITGLDINELSKMKDSLDDDIQKIFNNTLKPIGEKFAQGCEKLKNSQIAKYVKADERLITGIICIAGKSIKIVGTEKPSGGLEDIENIIPKLTIKEYSVIDKVPVKQVASNLDDQIKDIKNYSKILKVTKTSVEKSEKLANNISKAIDDIKSHFNTMNADIEKIKAIHPKINKVINTIGSRALTASNVIKDLFLAVPKELNARQNILNAICNYHKGLVAEAKGKKEKQNKTDSESK